MPTCGPKRLLRIEIRAGGVGNPGTMVAPPALRLLSEIVWKQHFVMAGLVGVGAVTVNATPDLALLDFCLWCDLSGAVRQPSGSYWTGAPENGLSLQCCRWTLLK
jgi:hypothetical protein